MICCSSRNNLRLVTIKGTCTSPVTILLSSVPHCPVKMCTIVLPELHNDHRFCRPPKAQITQAAFFFSQNCYISVSGRFHSVRLDDLTAKPNAQKSFRNGLTQEISGGEKTNSRSSRRAWRRIAGPTSIKTKNAKYVIKNWVQVTEYNVWQRTMLEMIM